MGKNKTKTMPRSKSVEELVDFFETHDMGDFWGKMRKAHFDISIKKRKHLVALEEDIVDKLTEIAKSKKVSSESLIIESNISNATPDHHGKPANKG